MTNNEEPLADLIPNMGDILTALAFSPLFIFLFAIGFMLILARKAL